MTDNSYCNQSIHCTVTNCKNHNATKNYYQDVLKKCHPSNRKNVEKKLQEVEECNGKTILEIIIDIILDTDDSGHWCELEIEE